MYIFDPDGGGRRSATARDAAHHVANAFDDAVQKTSRDLVKSFIETGHQPHDAYEKQMRGSPAD